MKAEERHRRFVREANDYLLWKSELTSDPTFRKVLAACQLWWDGEPFPDLHEPRMVGQ